MNRYVIILALLATTVSATDTTVFKNCAQVSFCKRLRNNELDDKLKFSANIVTSPSDDDNVVIIPLKNQNGDTLNMLIYLLEGNKIRVKIQEPESTRFELGDIIIVEKLKELTIIEEIANKSLLILPQNNSFPYSVRVSPVSPFTVKFYYQDQLQVILDAEKLVMENTEESQSFAFKVQFPGASKLYGLPDHAWTMSLGDTNNGTAQTMDPFRLRNSDFGSYPANSPAALYGAWPVIYGHSEKYTSGIFLHNAAQQWIDVASSDENPSAYFMVESAAFDLFILLGPTPKEVVRQFTGLTGKAHLPQIWALGYQQSRTSFKSQKDVKEASDFLTKNRFSFDAIWLDGDYTEDYKWFSWNRTAFTDPVKLQNYLNEDGRVCVTMSNPHIKVDEDYEVYAGAKKNYFVKWANGSNYEAKSSSGTSSWIDFMNPEASNYYSSWYSYEKFNSSTPTLAGIWNSMNEPSVFDESTENTMPGTVLHYGNVRHIDIHNIYGFLHTRSTHKALLNRDNNEKRPFVLTRSHFPGSQRFAAMWTGENSATWEHFANSYSECMNANMMGMVFCGADVGGFNGNASDELLQRWYQGAVWLPFFRGHSSSERKHRELYQLSSNVQDIIRDAIDLRNRHIPSLYTLFYEHTVTGDPIIRPLYYQYPGVNDRDTQLLLGTDIMAVAVTEENTKSVQVYFPGKENDYWYRIDANHWTQHKAGQTVQLKIDMKSLNYPKIGEKYTFFRELYILAMVLQEPLGYDYLHKLHGSNAIVVFDKYQSPVFYRAGSIIFTKDDERKSTVETLYDAYVVYVNLNVNRTASGRLYVDDFYSFQYNSSNTLYYIKAEHYDDTGLKISTIGGEHSYDIEKFVGIQIITINEIAVSKSGTLQTKKRVYNTTADGVPLASINVGRELRKSKEFFIKL